MLPRSIDAQAPAKNREPPQPPLGIVIGDNKECCNLLEREGLQVWAAKGSKEGLRLARKGHPAVVVVDLGSVEGDGRELALEMKLLPGIARVPVVAIATADQEKETQRKRQVFDASLAPPVKEEELRRILRTLLGRRVTREIDARRDRPLKVTSAENTPKPRRSRRASGDAGGAQGIP